MKKIKMITAGILVGLMAAGSVTAFAEAVKIEAYRTTTKISLDGQELAIPSDTPILNYSDRTYTPCRLVAEALGATVEWDAVNETVKITSPEPKVIEKEVIVEVPVEPEPSQSSDRDYLVLPVRYANKDFYIDVFGAEVFTNEAEFDVSIKVDSDDDVAVELNYPDAYILTGNDKIYADRSSSDWDDSIRSDETKIGALRFPTALGNDKTITIVLPVKVTNYTEKTEEQKTVTFYMDITEDED